MPPTRYQLEVLRKLPDEPSKGLPLTGHEALAARRLSDSGLTQAVACHFAGRTLVQWFVRTDAGEATVADSNQPRT